MVAADESAELLRHPYLMHIIWTMQVTSSGAVVPGKWSLCTDERTIIYDGPGAGSFCPLPFLYDRQFFDNCTRRSSNGTGFEPNFWCPVPSSVTGPQNLFAAGGQIGKCTNFLIPEGDLLKSISMIRPGNQSYKHS